MTMMDSLQRAIAFDADAIVNITDESGNVVMRAVRGDLYRPGYRFAVDRSAQDAAYRQMVQRQEVAWKTSARDAAIAAEPPLSEDPREDAYLRSVRSLENAWRGPR